MWQPTASQDTLKKRAQLLADCRSFFSQHQVMEVEVPMLGETGVTDPNIECIQTQNGVLQSSPEYFMKRLLAAGSGDIYALTKAFRSEEQGNRHSNEFTMLEWYRLGFNEHQLAAEVVDLIQFVSRQSIPAIYRSYADIFSSVTGLNPHLVSSEELCEFAKSKLDLQFDLPNKSGWLDLLFSHLIEPALEGQLYVIYDFPACQAALAHAQLNLAGETIARRFEVYWCGLELANGYFELCDAEEQARRFDQDNAQRVAEGKAEVVIDKKFLAAMESGLPLCAGVALGLDRLLMCLCGVDSIKAVQAFGPLG